MKRSIASLLFVCSVFACLGAQPPKGLLTAPLLGVEDIHSDNLKLETAQDGTQYVAMRLRVEAASAVRVLISGMQLIAGQQLFISNVDGTQVFGPFDIAGPTQSGEFWSEAIAGSDIVIELQTGPDGAADLPFKVEAIEAADFTEVPASVTDTKREVAESLYRGVSVTHEIIDGMAVYEGDILLGRANELPSSRAGAKTQGRFSVGITSQSYRWPGATMPYVIASNMPSPSRITGAIDHWNSVMAGTVRMVPRTNETDYVIFVAAPSSGTCSSYVGRLFGGQSIQIGSYCSKGNIIHEIGHAWGLWHEHTREDRDQYVRINTENIQPGQGHNFTQNIYTGDDIGAYDYGSIMHYGKTSFSSNGLATIETIPAGIAIGQRTSLSTGDIGGIKALYPSGTQSFPPPVISTTITANPVGAVVSVDGVVVTTPASFDWPANSVHTIEAVNTVDSAARSTFVKWSDGGAQSHTVTASNLVTTFKADYALAYSVKAAATPVGIVVLSPVSGDTFYASGKSVSLTATPPTGYCFAGWNGLMAGTPNKTTVVATRSYDVEATFETGAITLAPAGVTAPGAGGTFSTSVTANTGCVWTAVSTATSWLTVTQVTANSGSGSVSFSAAPNTTGVARTAHITIAGKSVKVTQAGI